MYYANCEWYVDMGEHNKPLCERRSLRPAGCSECPVYIRSIEEENARLREQIHRLKQGDILHVLTDQEYIDQCERERLMQANIDALDKDNAKLRERIEQLQPTDIDGNVLGIADTVHMLRSEYDGDHEWEDVIIELALTKWGGDRWIVRGSKGEAWACECTKTGYDEDAFENSDTAELFNDFMLAEAENKKLRELVRDMYPSYCYANGGNGETYLTYEQDVAIRDRVCKMGVLDE